MTWRPEPPLWVDWLEAVAEAAIIAVVVLAAVFFILILTE